MNLSVREIKLNARKILDGHYRAAVGAALIVLTISLCFSMLISRFSYQDSKAAFLTGLSVSFILSLIEILFSSGLLYFFLKLGRGETTGAADVFACFRMQPDRFLIAGFFISLSYFIYCLPFFAAYEISRKSPLPALILACVWGIFGTVLLACFLLSTALFPFLLIDHAGQMGAVESLKESARLMKGHKGRLLHLNLSFIGWFLLALMSLSIGFLWVLPYYNTTLAGFYRDLTGEPALPPVPDSQGEAETF